MFSNISDPLPKKFDNPNEKSRNKSGDLDETKKEFFTTTDTVVRESNTGMVDKKVKQNLMW